MAKSATRIVREENYEEKFESKLPEDLHRGDVVPTARLQGYLDAISATCATFLAIPLRNLEEMEKEGIHDLGDYLYDRRFEFIMFFLGFSVVCSIWESYVVRFKVIKQLDDVLVLLTIVSMLAMCCLPFSLSLMGHYMHEHIPVLMTCVCLFAGELIEIIMIFYAFASPRLIHVELHDWNEEKLIRFRNLMCIKSVVNMIAIVVAGLLVLIHYGLAWAFLGLLILIPIARKFAAHLHRTRFASQDSELMQDPFVQEFMKSNIDKERVEVMSDAAVAIIACLLVLDITVEYFPGSEEVEKEGLKAILKSIGHKIGGFVGAFASVSFLWYVNHTVLHHYHTMNILLMYLQKLFLAFLSLLPLTSVMIGEYANSGTENELTADKIGYLFLFCAGLMNLLMLLVGYYRQEKVLHHWASTKAGVKQNQKQHLYVLLKTANIPFWTILIMFATLGSEDHIFIVMNVFYGAMIVCFLLLKMIFACHFGKQGYYFERRGRGGKSSTCENRELTYGSVHAPEPDEKPPVKEIST